MVILIPFHIDGIEHLLPILVVRIDIGHEQLIVNRTTAANTILVTLQVLDRLGHTILA